MESGREISIPEVLTRVVALRELMDERDRSYIERFSASERNVVTAMSAAEKAVTTAMTAAEKAVETAMTAAEKAGAKAETAAEKRFDLMTETAAIRFSALEKHISDLQHSLTSFQATLTGRHSGISDAWGWLAAVVMAAITAANLWLNSKGP